MTGRSHRGPAREPCAVCERRRRNRVLLSKVAGVLLFALAAALATKWYPLWAESIRVGVLVLVVIVTWLLTLGRPIQ